MPENGRTLLRCPACRHETTRQEDKTNPPNTTHGANGASGRQQMASPLCNGPAHGWPITLRIGDGAAYSAGDPRRP